MSDSPDQVIAKDNFKQFKAANYPKLSDDEAFERFAMSLVLKGYGASVSEVEKGIVSGKNDGGIDGFYIFLNGRESVSADSSRLTRRKTSLAGLQTGLSLDIVVVQAKKETSWDTNVFPKIESSLKAMFDKDISVEELREFPLNDDLIEKALTLRKARVKLATLVPVVRTSVQYVSLADQSNVDGYMKTKRKQLESWLTASLPTGSTTLAEYVGDAEVVKRLRTGTEFQATLKLSKHPIREANALVGLVTVKEYLKFLRRPGSKLLRDEMFAVNVRDFAGSNVRVNDAISVTLSTDSESPFWWLNNGITIIVDAANDPIEFEWVLSNPLIVNGLQTSHVIHEQDLEAKITAKRLRQSVLVRVITESDAQVREAIISGTNNQTAIASLQLHANDEKQIRIESYLRASDWHYERRRYQFRGTNAPASRIRNMSELGQAVMSYRLLQPDTARARPATLLGTQKGWERVFPPDQPEEIYLKALNAVAAIDSYLRTPAAKNIADDHTNARFYLLSGYALLSAGVRKLSDFELVPDSALNSAPIMSDLTKLHELLYEEVAKLDDGATARDRIFKGAKLRASYLDAVLELNIK